MPPTAIIDSNVVFGWRSERDQYNTRATEIIEGVRNGTLPAGVVPTQLLQEILKHVQNSSSWEEATKTLNWLSQTPRFDLDHPTVDDVENGHAIFRMRDGYEYPDALTVAYMRRNSIKYIYSFDGKFDTLNDITRLNAAVDPFQ